MRSCSASQPALAQFRVPVTLLGAKIYQMCYNIRPMNRQSSYNIRIRESLQESRGMHRTHENMRYLSEIACGTVRSYVGIEFDGPAASSGLGTSNGCSKGQRRWPLFRRSSRPNNMNHYDTIADLLERLTIHRAQLQYVIHATSREME